MGAQLNAQVRPNLSLDDPSNPSSILIPALDQVIEETYEFKIEAVSDCDKTISASYILKIQVTENCNSATISVPENTPSDIYVSYGQAIAV